MRPDISTGPFTTRTYTKIICFRHVSFWLVFNLWENIKYGFYFMLLYQIEAYLHTLFFTKYGEINVIEFELNILIFTPLRNVISDLLLYFIIFTFIFFSLFQPLEVQQQPIKQCFDSSMLQTQMKWIELYLEICALVL